jgi:hypothetical protein
LSVIDATLESPLDRAIVGSKRIGRDLRTVHDARTQIVNEDRGIVPRPSANMEAGNEFRIGIERNERVRIAELATIHKLRCPFLFHAHERPQFIQLEPLAVEVPHFTIHQFRAGVPDTNHEPHDRIAVDAGHPFDATKAVALYQSRNDATALIWG